MLDDILRTIDPTLIIVKDERPRHRKDLGEIKKLAESIEKYGQIQPIVVTRNMELVAGGRRLAACLMGGFQAKICFSDELDEVVLRELELEENLQRKALTPAEEAFAISDLVELKQKRYGKPVQGKQGGYTLSDAAELVGKTKGYIIEALQIADVLKTFPELKKCDTKSEIKLAAKGLDRIDQNMKAMLSYETKIKQNELFNVLHQSAQECLAAIPDGSIDLFFTDPPYGIDIHNSVKGLGGKTGGTTLSTTGIVYDDSVEYAKDLLSILAKESFRVTKDTGHVYIFCAIANYFWLLEEMSAAGWIVRERPIIWTKRGTPTGNNQPDKWPSSAYELILFARKPASSLILQGRIDYIPCEIILPGARLHQAEKPIPLLKDLIARTCLPGYTLVDPCMGSGAIIEAAADMKVFATGCDIDIESYAAAVARMVKWEDRQ